VMLALMTTRLPIDFRAASVGSCCRRSTTCMLAPGTRWSHPPKRKRDAGNRKNWAKALHWSTRNPSRSPLLVRARGTACLHYLVEPSWQLGDHTHRGDRDSGTHRPTGSC
jgi:hypothetical protein